MTRIVVFILFIIGLLVISTCRTDDYSISEEFDLYDAQVDSSQIDSLFDALGSRQIARVVIHCTASFGNLDSAKLMSVFKQRWGENTRPGYHMVVFKGGNIVVLQPLDEDEYIQSEEIVWGARGYNSTSIHISYDGGIDQNMNPKDTRTHAQKNAMGVLVDMFKCRYPDIRVVGHRNLSTKACPSFDAFEEYNNGTLIEQSDLYDTLQTATDSTDLN